MDSGNQPANDREEVVEKTSLIKQHALPLSVIVSSWLSGIIACGVTCSFTAPFGSVLTAHPSRTVRLAASVWVLLAVMLGIYVGMHVGRDGRNRYRKEKK